MLSCRRQAFPAGSGGKLQPTAGGAAAQVLQMKVGRLMLGWKQITSELPHGGRGLAHVLDSQLLSVKRPSRTHTPRVVLLPLQ